MRKWAYRVNDKFGGSRHTNCKLKDLKPALAAMRKLAKGDRAFDEVLMSRPIHTLLIENALLNTYSLQNVTAITVQLSEE